MRHVNQTAPERNRFPRCESGEIIRALRALSHVLKASLPKAPDENQKTEGLSCCRERFSRPDRADPCIASSTRGFPRLVVKTKPKLCFYYEPRGLATVRNYRQAAPPELSVSSPKC